MTIPLDACVVTPEVRAAVDATGRKKLIMAGLVTEVCLARSVLALGLPETPNVRGCSMTIARRLSPEVRERAAVRYRNRAVYSSQRGADFSGHWEEYDGTLPDAPLHGVGGS
jgi:hypothetical protein